MYISFGRGFIPTDKPNNSFFYVNNCGIYKNISHKISVNRPNGRNDYQIIYVSEGHIYVHLNSQIKKAEKGSIIVFEPKKKQVYFTDDNKINTSYLWIHFTGTKANEIMTSLKLSTGIYNVGKFEVFSLRCREIIDEMRKNDDLSNIKISGLAISLIGEIPKKLAREIPDEFSNVILQMENDKPNGTKIKDYAEQCNLSHGHFIKLFKAKYGITPSNYRLKLLIDKSRTILIDTELKISDVAMECGFEDPLYFSRIFKKYIGVSPENYRKKYR